MDEQKPKSIFDALEPKQTFLVGIVGGFLILCTIGFFILLSMFMKQGGGFGSAGDDVAAVQPSAPAAAAGEAAGPDVNAIAKSLKLNTGNFTKCLASDAPNTVIAADQASGEAVGVPGTPNTILLSNDGKTKTIGGALPFEQVDAMIAEMLKGATVSEGLTVAPVTNADHIRGAKNAKITMVEYSDLQCPYCQAFHPTMIKILAKYPNDVRWVYRHYPLPFHPNAKPLAVASECASEQGKFWEFVDAVFQG